MWQCLPRYVYYVPFEGHFTDWRYSLWCRLDAVRLDYLGARS